MPSVQMTLQTEDGVGQAAASFKFHYKDQLAAPGNGAWVIYPRGANGVTIILNSTGDGRVEATTASRADIEAGTVGAEEISVWPHGDIGADKKVARLSGVAAFRQVNISGTTIMSALGDR